MASKLVKFVVVLSVFEDCLVGIVSTGGCVCSEWDCSNSTSAGIPPTSTDLARWDGKLAYSGSQDFVDHMGTSATFVELPP